MFKKKKPSISKIHEWIQVVCFDCVIYGHTQLLSVCLFMFWWRFVDKSSAKAITCWLEMRRDPVLCGVIKFPVAAAERNAHGDSERHLRLRVGEENPGCGLPAPHWCLYFVPLWSAPLIKAAHNQSRKGEWQDSIWAWQRSWSYARQEVPIIQGHVVNLTNWHAVQGLPQECVT